MTTPQPTVEELTRIIEQLNAEAEKFLGDLKRRSGRHIESFLRGGCLLLAGSLRKALGSSARLVAVHTTDEVDELEGLTHVGVFYAEHLWDARGALPNTPKGHRDFVAWRWPTIPATWVPLPARVHGAPGYFEHPEDRGQHRIVFPKYADLMEARRIGGMVYTTERAGVLARWFREQFSSCHGQASRRGWPNAGAGWRIVAPDGYEYAGDALFRTSQINLASYEDLHRVCVTDDGKVLGALAYGFTGETVRFSVAVDPAARRTGIARALVAEAIHYFRAELDEMLEAYALEHLDLEAWVVNPHMGTLLETMGFESDGQWSQGNPMMIWDGVGGIPWERSPGRG